MGGRRTKAQGPMTKGKQEVGRRGASGSWRGDEFAQGGGDGGGGEIGEIAAAGWRATRRLEEAGGGRKDGAGADGVRRAEEADQGDTEGVGEVQAAGVVGDEDVAGAEAVAIFRERGAPSEVFDAGGIEAGSDGGGERGVVNRAKEDEAGGGESLDERAPVRDGPAFGGGVFGAANQPDGLTS